MTYDSSFDRHFPVPIVSFLAKWMTDNLHISEFFKYLISLKSLRFDIFIYIGISYRNNTRPYRTLTKLAFVKSLINQLP